MDKYRIKKVKENMLEGIDKIEEVLKDRNVTNRLTNCTIFNRPNETLFHFFYDICLVDLQEYLIVPKEYIDEDLMKVIQNKCNEIHGINSKETACVKIKN